MKIPISVAAYLSLLALALVVSPLQAAEQKPGSVGLTIYSTAQPGAIPPEMYRPAPGTGGSRYGGNIPGYAMVRQEREVSIDKERSTLRFTDVAALIDPTTVRFVSLTDPGGTRVLEQSYQFDLVDTLKLMQRYLDRDISVQQVTGDAVTVFAGKLLSTTGGLVLQTPDKGVQVLNGYASVQLPELPQGLITRPTLVWDVRTDKPGKQRVRVTYQTGGVTWWADYNLVFAEGKDANHGTLDVGAWVSILNQSGGSYEDAALKLIAGDIHRAERPQPVLPTARRVMEARAVGEGFAEKPFFEYHLYTLGRSTTLPDSSTKQIELFPTVRGVPAEKVLVYYGLANRFPGYFADPMTDRGFGVQSNKKVDIYLRFKNTKDAGLGMPLPSGRVRVSKLDTADNSLELIGEDTIDHTPKDETVMVQLGSAFDVVGERKQVDFKIDTTRKQMQEEIEISLRNHKEQPVEVLVKENLYRWSNWKIVQKTHDYKKVDARTIEFPVKVAKDGEATVRYSVQYSW